MTVIHVLITIAIINILFYAYYSYHVCYYKSIIIEILTALSEEKIVL